MYCTELKHLKIISEWNHKLKLSNKLIAVLIYEVILHHTNLFSTFRHFRWFCRPSSRHWSADADSPGLCRGSRPFRASARRCPKPFLGENFDTLERKFSRSQSSCSKAPTDTGMSVLCNDIVEWNVADRAVWLS